MTVPKAAPFWATAGVWIVVVGAALMLVNAIRATVDPVGFATYLGLPLADPADAGLLGVYAARALFIGLLAIALLATRQQKALALFAFAASIMPLADAWLSSQAGAPLAVVGRHLAIAPVLVLAGVLLTVDARRAARSIRA